MLAMRARNITSFKEQTTRKGIQNIYYRIEKKHLHTYNYVWQASNNEGHSRRGESESSTTEEHMDP